MSKPKMLAAEQPPETETEAAADAAARDALVVETAAPPVPEGEPPAEVKMADAMAAAWAGMSGMGNANHTVSNDPGMSHSISNTGGIAAPPGFRFEMIAPPGYKLVPVDQASPHAHATTVLPGLVITLDDHQAAADDGLTPITARLKPSVMQYLTDRAAMYGETPEAHLATIVRLFRLTDTQRPDLARLPGNEVGMPALARPR